MEISNVQLVKPFGPLVMMAELPETVIKSCNEIVDVIKDRNCLLYTSPSPRDGLLSRMPSSA